MNFLAKYTFLVIALVLLMPLWVLIVIFRWRVIKELISFQMDITNCEDCDIVGGCMEHRRQGDYIKNRLWKG